MTAQLAGSIELPPEYFESYFPQVEDPIWCQFLGSVLSIGEGALERQSWRANLCPHLRNPIDAERDRDGQDGDAEVMADRFTNAQRSFHEREQSPADGKGER